MTMVEVKVSELSRAALDWAVAQTDSVAVKVLPKDNQEERWPTQYAGYPGGPYWPSVDWSQGGPLIEANKIAVSYDFEDGEWIATSFSLEDWACGETPLIAACRAIVASKFGDTVSVPAELMECGQ